MNAELIERLREALRLLDKYCTCASVPDDVRREVRQILTTASNCPADPEAEFRRLTTDPDEATSARRRDALRRMVALDEEMGLYDDEAVPPSRVTPNMTGSVSERFIEALKFARYYLVDALEIQDNADLRDALWTMDCLIDPGNPLAPEATSTQEVGPVSFAWTAANGRPYPPYINLAGNRIRVRGEPSHGEVMPFTTGWIEGPYVSVELPDEAIEGLRQALSRRPADDERSYYERGFGPGDGDSRVIATPNARSRDGEE